MHRHFSAYWWADRRARWRVIVLVIFLLFAGVLLLTGTDPTIVIGTVGGVGMAAVMVIRALFDQAPAATAPEPEDETSEDETSSAPPPAAPRTKVHPGTPS